jgi:hypothetical protein
MANAPSAKVKKGKRKLLPFYVGITEGKTLKNKPYKHTHYVLIDERVTPRLGIKSQSKVKPGNTDQINDGVVFQKNRRKSVGDKKPYTAKRAVKQCQKSITAYCKSFVKNKQGEDVPETYSIGFASNIPLRLIIKFFKDNAPSVVRIGTGGNQYQVR